MLEPSREQQTRLTDWGPDNPWTCTTQCLLSLISVIHLYTHFLFTITRTWTSRLLVVLCLPPFGKPWFDCRVCANDIDTVLLSPELINLNATRHCFPVKAYYCAECCQLEHDTN